MKKIVIVTLLVSLNLLFLNEVDAARTRISTEWAQSEYSDEDIGQEILFGREMAAIILADIKMMDHEQLNRYVNLVGNSVLQHSTRQEIPFYFTVINSPVVNAYAAPGGYVFITRGALNLMRSEAELAGVLAHEIAHISQRHIVKALKIKAEDDSVTGALGQIVGSAGSSAGVIFDQAVGKAVEILFSKGLKQQDEYEADEVGIVLTTLAGYDPTAYYDYLQRIKPYVEEKNGQLTKTHPPISSRLNKLNAIIENEGLNQLNGYINSKRFKENTNTAME